MIKSVTTSGDFDLARSLFTEYRAELNVDLCFQSFAEELSNLSKIYSPPKGCLLLAYLDEMLAGCVGFKQLDPETCEMKRLYVKSAFRGKKLGLALTTRIIDEARSLHYKLMRLDTLTTLKPAVALYRRLGFKKIPPYYHNPLDNVLYFQLNL